MPSSRFQAESDFDPRIRLYKTIAGLLVFLGLLVLFLAVSLRSRGKTGEEGISAGEAPVAYVSAILGRLQMGSDGEETRVQEGETLESGTIYKLDAGEAAIIRLYRTDIDVVISGRALFTMGSHLDPARLSLPEGSAEVMVYSDAGANVPFQFGMMRLIPKNASHFTYSGGGSPTLTMLEGSLRVNIGDAEEELGAGEKLINKNDELTIEEFELLDAPSPLQPAGGTLFRRTAGTPLELEFIWSEIAGANGYQFELSSNLLFKRNVYERRVSDASVTIADLSEGVYYWRAQAVASDGAMSPPSEAVPFSVVLMGNPEDEAVSAPELELTDVSSQSNLISIRGKTEPGARIRVRLESFGRIIIEPMEILVQSNGDFVTLVEAPLAGQFDVFVEAFYRPEFVTTEITTIEVDF